jgi:hypothetical protein
MQATAFGTLCRKSGQRQFGIEHPLKVLIVSVQPVRLFTYVPPVWCRFAPLASLAGPRLSRMSRPKVVGLYGFCR